MKTDTFMHKATFMILRISAVLLKISSAFRFLPNGKWNRAFTGELCGVKKKTS
ncbi:hypothetical protein [Mucilaginibacter angelicae]|uniref:hypothetical protein n=1 Tax=Mucilaginibacter angelicae TaxID=869718 RepID=UPI00367253FA